MVDIMSCVDDLVIVFAYVYTNERAWVDCILHCNIIMTNNPSFSSNLDLAMKLN